MDAFISDGVGWTAGGGGAVNYNAEHDDGDELGCNGDQEEEGNESGESAVGEGEEIDKICVGLLPTLGPYGKTGSCGLGIPGEWIILGI